MASPTSASLIQPGRAPLTPARTFERMGRQQPPPVPGDPLDYIKRMTRRLAGENRLHSAAKHATALTNEMVARGQQFGRVDLEGNFRQYKRGPGDPRYTHNFYGGYS